MPSDPWWKDRATVRSVVSENTADPEPARMLNWTGSGKCLACNAPAGVHCEPCLRAREPLVRRAIAMSIPGEDHWPMMPAKETPDDR